MDMADWVDLCHSIQYVDPTSIPRPRGRSRGEARTAAGDKVLHAIRVAWPCSTDCLAIAPVLQYQLLERSPL